MRLEVNCCTFLYLGVLWQVQFQVLCSAQVRYRARGAGVRLMLRPVRAQGGGLPHSSTKTGKKSCLWNREKYVVRTDSRHDGRTELSLLPKEPILLQSIKVPNSKMSNEMTIGLTIGLYKVCLVALDDLSLPENK